MARMPSNMVHTFSQVPKAEIPRSSFDRTHTHKTTIDKAGILYPILVDEALPGDTFNVSMTGFCRLATPLHPYMDNVFFNTFFFAVPIRLIWDNWQRFNGEQDNPGDSTDFLVPQIDAGVGGFTPGWLDDYLGLPVSVPNLRVCSFWHRAYNLIWNEWFRDQNLQDRIAVPKGDGPDFGTEFALMPRGKRHDYFSSSLPWPQKGESVSIPLGTAAPVHGLGLSSNSNWLAGPMTAYETGPTTATYLSYKNVDNADPNRKLYINGDVDTGPIIYADLQNATAASINQLRQAFQVQRLHERDARGGTRYTEVVRSHFGVVSPDARLQRPEYLGGGQSPVNVAQVPQTSPPTSNENGDTPQGNLAGFGTSVMSGHGFSKSFTEHCVILGLVCVRADITYQQGLERMFSRRSRFDFYWPALSHIGEQAVLSKEIYCDGTANDETVWGYQERYAEYRYKNSKVTGQMRSNFAQSLDTWHLALDFASRPLLNDVFIADKPPIERVIAVPSEPHFIGDFYFRVRAARPMPVYGVPGMMDHF